MIMPFFQAIMDTENSSGGLYKYLNPILKNFAEESAVFIVGMIVLMLFILKTVFFILRRWLSTKYSLHFREKWANIIMRKYMSAEYLFHLSHKQGTLLHNLINETTRAAKALRSAIEFSANFIVSVCLYGVLFFVNWKVTVFVTVVFGIVTFLLRKSTYKFSMDAGEEILKVSQGLNSIGMESITGIRQIKTFSLESSALKKFSEKINRLMRVTLKFNVISAIPKPLMESFIVMGFVSAILYLHYVFKNPFVNVIPILTCFIVVSYRLFNFVSLLYTERMNILSFLPSLKLILEFCESDHKEEVLDKGYEFHKIKEDIVFNKVNFAYPNSKPLFNNLSFTIPKGKVTALVGPSGSGKSTIVDLLTRLLDQQEGQILVNGMDFKEISLRSWRKAVSYISQDVFLFNTSVRDNIMGGNPNASEEDVVDFARKANAHEFISNLSEGYETILGDRGLKISGGERQRIAIARGLIRNPQLLIFDEATSALDPESEKLLQESLNSFAEKRTVIIITHKLNSVKKADKIIVLDKGQVIEEGTFEELINNQGVYREMLEMNLA